MNEPADIVKRLRSELTWGLLSSPRYNLILEAADLIERLSGAREEQREAVTRPMIEFRQELREKREAELRAIVIEECAKVCEEHADFCHNEAHSGGDFKHLVARRDEANYLAERIRALGARKEQP